MYQRARDATRHENNPLVCCAECEHYRNARVVDGRVVPLKRRCPWCGSTEYRDGRFTWG